MINSVENFLKAAILFAFCLVMQTAWATDYTWTGSTSTAWNISTNWSPNGIPGSTDRSIIVNATNLPLLDQARSVQQFEIYSGTLDLNTYTLTVTSNSSFLGGTINNGTINSTGSTAGFNGTTFGANVSVSCSSILLNGSTFNGTNSFTKTGNGTDVFSGNSNTFNGTTTFTNSSIGNLYCSNGNTFNASVTFNLTNSGFIFVSDGSNTQFNDNIVYNATGGGLVIGEGSGTSTLASGKTISVGGSGVTGGVLKLKNFTQSGSTPQNLTLTGSAYMVIGPGSTFNGKVNFSVPGIFLNGCTYNDSTTITKTGTSTYFGDGGNIFNGAAILKNTGSSGYLLSGSTYPDTFNGNLTITNTGTGNIFLSHFAAGTAYNGNIKFNQTAGGAIYFGNNGGTSTLANTKTLSVGTFGVSNGYIELKNFTQSGSTAQSMTFSGNSNLALSTGTTFNGNVTFSSPGIFLDGSTYNGTANLTKTGAGDNTCDGGNTFNGDATITNNGSGDPFLMLANSFPDVYNANVTFNRSGVGDLFAAHTGINKFYGNITSNGAVNYGANGGTISLEGWSAQTLSGTVTVEIPKFKMNKTASSLTLSTPLNVTSELNLTDGTIVSSSTNLLIINDNVTMTGGSSESYVLGPVKKKGNDAFTFHVGKGEVYMPVTMSAPSVTTDEFTAEAFNTTPPNYGSYDAIIKNIGSYYWNVTRVSGSSNVQLTLKWSATTPKPIFPEAVHVAQQVSSQWQTKGANSVSDNYPEGSVTSNTLSSFGNFTLGFTKVNPVFSYTDMNKNWNNSRSYDEYGRVVGEERYYTDKLGRTTQSLERDFVNNITHVKASGYDPLGRKSISALPAPLADTSYSYQNTFMTADGTNPYGSNDYDKAITGSNFLGEVNNPKPLSTTSQTASPLGWYYSNNNNKETHVATTSYPYDRIYYNDTISGGMVKMSQAGDALRMGAGHESKAIVLPLLNELNHYAKLRNSWFVTTGTDTSLAWLGTKEVTIEENGKEAIVFKDRNGKMLATAISNGTTYTDVIGEISPEFYYTGFTVKNLTDIIKPSAPDSIQIWYVVSGSGTLKYSGPAKIITPAEMGISAGPSSFEFQIRSKNNFTVRYVPHMVTTGIYTQLKATASGRPILDLYLKTSTGFSLDVSSATGIQIKVKDLNSGGTLYTGAASSFSVGSLTLPGFFRIEVTGYSAFATSYGSYKMKVNYKFNYTDWTYNYYDDAGRLVAAVAPKGVVRTSTADPKFVNKHTYNTMGQRLSTDEPDLGLTTFVYRKDGMLRFSQNDRQKNSNANKFSYINYDRFARIIEKGEHDPTAGSSPLVYETQSLSPVTNSVLNILESTVIGGGLGASCGCRTQKRSTVYDVAGSGIPLGRTQRYLEGKISKTFNDNSATWYSYDEQGRVEWTVQTITGLGDKTLDYIYGTAGKVTKLIYQKDVSSERFEHEYVYNANSNLIEVYSKAGNNARQKEAAYQYYLHGPIKRIEIADSLQGIDYLYTVKGWIKAINHPSLSNKDAGGDGYSGLHSNFAKDVFGMVVQYYDDDYVRSGSNIRNLKNLSGYDNNYNGKGKAMLWQTKGHDISGNMLAYAFKYDYRFQFNEANFGTVSTSSDTTFTVSGTNMYRVYDISYDMNGNLLTKKANDGSGTSYDDFTYEYGTTTNRLNGVKITGTSNYHGSYLYNAIGSVTRITNLDGTQERMTYDTYSGVTEVRNASNQLMVTYSYNENGHRIKKMTYNSSGVLSYTTWYVRDGSGRVMSVYDDRSGTMGQTEIPIYGEDRLGLTRKSGSTYTYEYELTDHLGNVRATISRVEVFNEANILSWADYYPHGNVMPGRSGTSSPEYRYGYQGKYAEMDNETGWNSFEFRSYDSRIGRWLQPDEARQCFSPYVAMANDPVFGVDPDGRKTKVGKFLQKAAKVVKVVAPIVAAVAVGVAATALTVATMGAAAPLAVAIVAGAVGGAAGSAAGSITQQAIQNKGHVDWGKVGRAALIGGVVGGATGGLLYAATAPTGCVINTGYKGWDYGKGFLGVFGKTSAGGVSTGIAGAIQGAGGAIAAGAGLGLLGIAAAVTTNNTTTYIEGVPVPTIPWGHAILEEFLILVRTYGPRALSIVRFHPSFWFLFLTGDTSPSQKLKPDDDTKICYILYDLCVSTRKGWVPCDDCLFNCKNNKGEWPFHKCKIGSL